MNDFASRVARGGYATDPKYQSVLHKMIQNSKLGGIIPKFQNSGKFYTIKQGDTLLNIAKKNNLQLPQILKLNPSIQDPNKIQVGQQITLIPSTNQLYEQTNDLIRDNLSKRKGPMFFQTDLEKEMEDKVQSNYYDPVHFRIAFEDYLPAAKYIKDEKNNTQTLTIGYGNTALFDENGNKQPLTPGQKISREEALLQSKRYDKFVTSQEIERAGLKNFSKYPPQLQFVITDALYNVRNMFGNSKNFKAALLQYEKNQGYLDPNYDYSLILRHAN